ncbi:hypothetical protein ACFCYC_25080, partial [Streptomyces sp. NPDC056402]
MGTVSCSVAPVAVAAVARGLVTAAFVAPALAFLLATAAGHEGGHHAPMSTHWWLLGITVLLMVG